MNQTNESSAELTRLHEDREGRAAWKKWGPYLSERQWGTVREDYSSNGDAWNYFTHDHAQYRAYRWGEGGVQPAVLGAVQHHLRRVESGRLVRLRTGRGCRTHSAADRYEGEPIPRRSRMTPSSGLTPRISRRAGFGDIVSRNTAIPARSTASDG